MQLTPTLTFNGNAEEALEHYRAALGGELEILRFEGSPMADAVCADFRNKVMYGTLRSPFGDISAADTSPERGGSHPGDNFTLGVSTDAEGDVDPIFSKLGAGGEVTMELQPTFWSARFGMLTDRFGIRWMDVAPPASVPSSEPQRVPAAV